jgi:hypothetical protein
MPAFGKLEHIPFNEILDTLNRVETIEAAADEFRVSTRTIERHIAGRASRHICWKPITTVDAKRTTIDMQTTEEKTS